MTREGIIMPDLQASIAKSYSFDLKFFKRIFRLVPWLFPSLKSIPVLLFCLLLCLGILEQYLIYNIGLVPSKYYKALGDKDQGAFWKETGLAITLIASKAFVQSTGLYMSSLLYVIWRNSVTKRLHSRYFKEVLYYTINVIDKTVDNPDQRITQDVDKLCETLSQIAAPIIIAPFIIVYYIYKAQQSSGYVGPVGVVIFFIIATVINKLLMSPVVKYVFHREKMEGNFRFKHMQIRSNSESAAFYRSGCIENDRTNFHLQKLIEIQHKLIKRQYALNFSITLFDYLGSIFSYIAIAFPIFLGAYDSLTAPELSALISANAFVVIYLINCFTRLIDLSLQVTDIAGTTHRVAELIEALGHAQEHQQSRAASRPGTMMGLGWSEMYGTLRETLVQGEDCDSGSENEGEDQDRMPVTAFQVSDLAYTAPRSSLKLCTGLSFKFEAGVNLLLTGDSGCGKSSLLRVINGIWPEVRGTIDHMVDLRPQVILFLPQKPYFTDGSLRQQIMFPLKAHDTSGKPVTVDDDRIHAYLEKTGLSHICTRVGGLDTQVEWNWYDELSPGEMQRLSFVRLFFHNPKFCVLDEATSQVGLPAEAELYEMCHQLKITIMSVGHRDSLRKYHHVELNIDSESGWCLRPILDQPADVGSDGQIN